MCDRVAIINHGQVVACDHTTKLIRRLNRKELALILGEALDAIPLALARFDVELHSPRRLVVRYRPSETRIADILDAVDQAGLVVHDLTTTEPDLEDLFLELTRRAAE